MRRLFQALAKTSDGAFIINEQQQIIFWNQAAGRILGYTAESIIDQPCYEVLGGCDEQGRLLCQRYCRVAAGTLKGEIQPNLDVHVLTQDGKRRWINVTTFAYDASNGSVQRVVVHLFRDADRQKSNERFVADIITAAQELQQDGEPHQLTPPIQPAAAPGLEALTGREQQVLLLLAQGLATEEMGSLLNISPATTRNHVQNILSKLGVHSRLEAVAYAYQQGLIDVNNQ